MSQLNKVKVWDLPTRIFHWSLVLLMAALWWTADQGEMEWHQVCAYLLMINVVFRWFWGVIGSETARFRDFITWPKNAFGYVTSRVTPKTLGHNPLGGYMVLAFLVMLLVQLGTGLFASDDIFTEGPLYQYVSSDTASTLTWLHKLNFEVLLYMIGAHVVAVVLHQLKGDKIIGAMFSGSKLTEHQVTPPKMSPWWVSLIIFIPLATMIAVYLIIPILQFI